VSGAGGVGAGAGAGAGVAESVCQQVLISFSLSVLSPSWIRSSVVQSISPISYRYGTAQDGGERRFALKKTAIGKGDGWVHPHAFPRRYRGLASKEFVP